jgi:hypothetical protein
MLLKKLIKAGRKKVLDTFIFCMYKQRIGGGPFKGMRYTNRAHGSALSPKIIGTYEEELHPVITAIAATSYEQIIDIGCAEGYYAVGLAYLYKQKRYNNFKVYAYDINLKALVALKKLATLNGVEAYIETRSLCTHKELDSFSGRKTLIICDIEGNELQLLDPTKATGMYNMDMLVELHDGHDFFITQPLKDRFENTHAITVIDFQKRIFTEAPWWLLSKSLRTGVISEGRRKGLKWMYLNVKKKE